MAAACADRGSSPVAPADLPPPAPEVETPPGPELLTLQPGSHEFTFREDRPILVRYHLPDGYTPSTPIVFVMHGNGRTGDSYFRAWRQPAIDYGFLLVVPEFDAEHYPGSRSYNLGNIFPGEEPTVRNPESDWTFTAIEDLFDAIREAAGSTRTAFRIYGHSAGGQFVHRLLMTRPDAPVERAVAANAGWYTMPTEEVRWPYGLGGSGFELTSLADRFQQDVTILLGDQDTDPNHPGLRRTPEAGAGAASSCSGPHLLQGGGSSGRVSGRALRVGARDGPRSGTPEQPDDAPSRRDPVPVGRATAEARASARGTLGLRRGGPGGFRMGPLRNRPWIHGPLGSSRSAQR